MLVVLGLLACGAVVGRLRMLPDGTAEALDRFVIVLALPGIVLARVPDLTLDTATLVPIAVAWGQLLVLTALVLVASRVAGWSRSVTGTLLLCVPLGNTSFLGFPAVEALLGDEHLGYAIVYDQLGTFLALATWGTFVAARYGTGTTRTAVAVARRVVTFPPFVALIVALLLRTTGVPAVVDGVAEALGASLTPVTMVAIGLRLRLPERAALGPLATGLGLRMLLAPALVLGLAALVGASGLAWETSTLEAAMPPMVTAGVIAIASGLDERLATALTGGGVILAMATLPLVAALAA